MNREEWNSLAKEAGGEAQRLYPTLTDYLAHIHETVETAGKLPFYEPRRVHTPGGYHTFKCVAATLYGVVLESMLQRMAGLVPEGTQITATSLAFHVLHYGVPVYYVTEDFIRAVAATDLPDDFTLEDLHWPMPGMVLGFPTRFMREYAGRDISYVMAGRIEGGTTYPTLKQQQKDVGSRLSIMTPRTNVCWHVYGWDKGKLGSYVASYHTEDRVSEVITKYAYTCYTDDGQEAIQQDHEMLNRVSSLMLKLLVVLNTRPSLVEVGHKERPALIKHGRLRPALWAPTMIGANYHVIRSGPAQGTHASPRLHWRRGHLTHQRIGSPKSPDFVSIDVLPRTPEGLVDWDVADPEVKKKFWASHKRVWLEPVLVSMTEEEDKKI